MLKLYLIRNIKRDCTGSKIPLTAQEYVIAEIGAKKFGFKTVDEFTAAVTVQFILKSYGKQLDIHEAKKFCDMITKETTPPDLTIEELVRKYDSFKEATE